MSLIQQLLCPYWYRRVNCCWCTTEQIQFIIPICGRNHYFNHLNTLYIFPCLLSKILWIPQISLAISVSLNLLRSEQSMVMPMWFKQLYPVTSLNHKCDQYIFAFNIARWVEWNTGFYCYLTIGESILRLRTCQAMWWINLCHNIIFIHYLGPTLCLVLR